MFSLLFVQVILTFKIFLELHFDPQLDTQIWMNTPGSNCICDGLELYCETLSFNPFTAEL